MKQAFALLGSILLLSSCESKAGTGAIAGAGAGALAGGLIGGGTGALIGGAVGATTGAVIGAALDASDRDKLQENSPQTLQRIDNRQQLSIKDIEALAENGIGDDVIISQIQTTNSVFHLTSDEIIDLKNHGVSEKVIEYMIQTGRS